MALAMLYLGAAAQHSVYVSETNKMYRDTVVDASNAVHRFADEHPHAFPLDVAATYVLDVAAMGYLQASRGVTGLMPDFDQQFYNLPLVEQATILSVRAFFPIRAGIRGAGVHLPVEYYAIQSVKNVRQALQGYFDFVNSENSAKAHAIAAAGGRHERATTAYANLGKALAVRQQILDSAAHNRRLPAELAVARSQFNNQQLALLHRRYSSNGLQQLDDDAVTALATVDEYALQNMNALVSPEAQRQLRLFEFDFEQFARVFGEDISLAAAMDATDIARRCGMTAASMARAFPDFPMSAEQRNLYAILPDDLRALVNKAGLSDPWDRQTAAVLFCMNAKAGREVFARPEPVSDRQIYLEMMQSTTHWVSIFQRFLNYDAKYQNALTTLEDRTLRLDPAKASRVIHAIMICLGPRGFNDVEQVKEAMAFYIHSMTIDERLSEPEILQRLYEILEGMPKFSAYVTQCLVDLRNMASYRSNLYLAERAAMHIGTASVAAAATGLAWGSAGASVAAYGFYGMQASMVLGTYLGMPVAMYYESQIREIERAYGLQPKK